MNVLNWPVEMLCLCDAMGSMSPLRFRYEDPEHILVTIRIGRVLAVKAQQLLGQDSYLYVCQAEMGGRVRVFELRYTAATRRWVLYRMLN